MLMAREKRLLSITAISVVIICGLAVSDSYAEMEVDHAPYLHVYYGVMRAELAAEITSDFQVDFKWLMGNYGDTGYLWMMNSTGTEGYGLRWNAGSDSPGYRGGHINIIKYDSTNEYERYRHLTEPGSFTQLVPGAEYISGDSTVLPFADFVFTWDGSTGDLTARVIDASHGIHMVSATDTDFASFSRIYITASTEGEEFFIDEILIDPIVTMTCQELIANGFGIKSDLNDDCYVDLEDMAILAADWLRCNDPEDEDCESM